MLSLCCQALLAFHLGKPADTRQPFGSQCSSDVIAALVVFMVLQANVAAVHYVSFSVVFGAGGGGNDSRLCLHRVGLNHVMM